MKIVDRSPPDLRADRPATRLEHNEAGVRVVTFHLSRGQLLPEHSSPSTVVLAVVDGGGVFSGGDGSEQTLGPGEVVIYGAGEPHSVMAVTDTLTFRAFITPGPER